MNPILSIAETTNSNRAGVVKGTSGAVHVNPNLLSGEDQTNSVFKVENQFEYETVAAGQTAQVLGANTSVSNAASVGDLLHSVVVTTSTGTITIYDNVTTVAVIPAAATGTWLFDIQSVSGAWNITTAAATTCVATGRFT